MDVCTPLATSLCVCRGAARGAGCGQVFKAVLGGGGEQTVKAGGSFLLLQFNM